MPIQTKQLCKKSSQTIFLFIHYNSLQVWLIKSTFPFQAEL